MTARQERQANRDRLMLARLKELAEEAEKAAAAKAKAEAAKVKPKPKPSFVQPEPKPVEKAPVKKEPKFAK